MIRGRCFCFLPQNKKFESFIDNEQLNAGFNIDDTMSDIFKACIIIEDDFIDSSTNKFIKLGNLIKNAVSEPISEASIGNKSNISSENITDTTESFSKINNEHK